MGGRLIFKDTDFSTAKTSAGPIKFLTTPILHSDAKTITEDNGKSLNRHDFMQASAFSELPPGKYWYDIQNDKEPPRIIDTSDGFAIHKPENESTEKACLAIKIIETGDKSGARKAKRE